MSQVTFQVVALYFILLHRVDGGVVFVNPTNITSLHTTGASIGRQNRLLPQEAHCAVGLTDGKFVSVIESCETVRRLLEGK